MSLCFEQQILWLNVQHFWTIFLLLGCQFNNIRSTVLTRPTGLWGVWLKGWEMSGAVSDHLKDGGVLTMGDWFVNGVGPVVKLSLRTAVEALHTQTPRHLPVT